MTKGLGQRIGRVQRQIDRAPSNVAVRSDERGTRSSQTEGCAECLWAGWMQIDRHVQTLEIDAQRFTGLRRNGDPALVLSQQYPAVLK